VKSLEVKRQGVIAIMLEDDPYSISTPLNQKTEVYEKEGEGLDSQSPQRSAMEAIFDRCFKKLDDFRTTFSQEMRDIVGSLKDTVDQQGRELEKHKLLITSLQEKVRELERGKREGGTLGEGSGEANLGHMQKLVAKQVEETQEYARRVCQLRITGLKENDRETTTMLRKTVVEVFEEKMQVEDAGNMLVDVFRIGKKGEDKFGRPRVIVARLGSMGRRNEILRGKPKLRGWKEIGVDVWRSKEEMVTFQAELKKKKEIDGKGGKAVLVKGKVVVIQAPKERQEVVTEEEQVTPLEAREQISQHEEDDQREEEEAHAGGQDEGEEPWIQNHRKGKKKKREIVNAGSVKVVYTRRDAGSTSAGVMAR
jgi:hypothetical protein